MEKKINPIDRLVKEKLENLSVPYDAGAWQLMEQKLDEEAMADAEAGTPAADARNIDEAVFEKLHRYEAPYQPAHWKRMESLIEGAFAWPRRVLRYKLTELALMLLLFLLLWQYAPDNFPILSSPQAMKEALPTATDTAGTTATTEDHDTTPASGQRKNRDIKGGGGAAQKSAAAAGETGGKGRKGQAGNIQGAAKGLMPISAGTADKRQAGPLSNALLPTSAGPLASKKYSLPEEWQAPSADFSFVSPFGPLQPSSPGLLAYENYRSFEEPTIERIKEGVTFRVGMFGSGEYNHIIVPQSQEKKLEERLDRFAIGYGGGLSLGMEFGRWELETGAIYASRQYPVGLLYLQGSVGGGFKGDLLERSQLNILNVPLHIRYNFLQHRQWRAYALAGASVQAVFLASHYTVEDPSYFYLPPSPSPPAPGMGQEETAIDRVRQEGLGWFEGGTFEENAYLTGNVGIGVERYISPRWSIFTQPTFQYSLQYFGIGLGANSDRVNSLTFLVGAKVRLK